MNIDHGYHERDGISTEPGQGVAGHPPHGPHQEQDVDQDLRLWVDDAITTPYPHTWTLNIEKTDMSRLVTAKPSLIPPVSMEEEVRYLTGEKELHLTFFYKYKQHFGKIE